MGDVYLVYLEMDWKHSVFSVFGVYLELIWNCVFAVYLEKRQTHVYFSVSVTLTR